MEVVSLIVRNPESAVFYLQIVNLSENRKEKGNNSSKIKRNGSSKDSLFTDCLHEYSSMSPRR